jgi:hypothetical protein
MNQLLSMSAPDGPQWMFFLLPILALLLIYEGGRRAIHFFKQHKRNKQSTEIIE